MPVDRTQFDADLTALISGQTTYISAVDALIQLPQIIDLAAEDAQVQAALTAIQTAQAQLPPPPGPGPSKA